MTIAAGAGGRACTVWLHGNGARVPALMLGGGVTPKQRDGGGGGGGGG